MQYSIVGDVMQAVKLHFAPGDRAQAEPGAMLYMKGDVDMDVSMKGGLLSGLARKFLMGEKLFMATFECRGRGAEVGFAVPYPGRVQAVNLNNSSIIAQKRSYLCAFGDVNLSVAFTKRLGAGFFGGEGFILEQIAGTGVAFIHAGGNFVEFDLAPGEQLRVDTGCLVAMDPTIDYDIQFIGGFTRSLFGGEGLFYALLTGPGHVLLQTLPFSRMAEEVLSAAHGRVDEQKGIAGIGGSILGNILSGDS
jgi:uncharacterized protein (TIGR00266 family)